MNPSAGAGTMLRATETNSGLDVGFRLLDELAPSGCAFLRGLLDGDAREVPAIHAMWTGPEISCPVPTAMVPAGSAVLPLENATIYPQPGDVVLAYVPPRLWGGGPDAVYDIGLFYGPGARLFFPIGWLAGSVVARAAPEALAAFARACGAIRRAGACTIRFSLAPG